VVHGIVKSHHGFIVVHSQPQVGTCFELYFPVAKTSPTTAAIVPGKTESKALPGGGGQRILLVDDEAAVLMLVERVLKRLGYQVLAFGKPREALECFKKGPQEFDLLLTDFTMPGMTGIDLAKAIHAIRADLPVILSSGYTGAYSRESMPDSCRFDVINKPASMQELAQALSKVFGTSPPQPAKVA
jgi:CheY-like chemotaxis protein